MINHSVINKRIRKAELWAEIKAYEQEYKRLHNQILEIKKVQEKIGANVEQKLNEIQELAESLDRYEYEIK